MIAIEARLGNATARKEISATPIPPIGTQLVVDSFAVYQYTTPCIGCDELRYWPFVHLRESGGSQEVTLVALHLQVGSESSGICKVTARFGPGESDYLYAFDTTPYVKRPRVLDGRRQTTHAG